MERPLEIRVRRARPADAATIAAFVNWAKHGELNVNAEEVVGRMGSVGFLLAESEDAVVGIAAWRAENLVGRVTDLLICPATARVTAGRALLMHVENAARQLQCEVVLLLYPPDSPRDLSWFFVTFGYEQRPVASLPGAWREAAREARLVDESIMLKQLRKELVRHPL